MEYRIEHDSMGEIRVPADKCWGAQTQRSVENFPIGVGLETMPKEIIRAFGLLKKAAAMANHAIIAHGGDLLQRSQKILCRILSSGIYLISQICFFHVQNLPFLVHGDFL